MRSDAEGAWCSNAVGVITGVIDATDGRGEPANTEPPLPPRSKLTGEESAGVVSREIETADASDDDDAVCCSGSNSRSTAADTAGDTVRGGGGEPRAKMGSKSRSTERCATRLEPDPR